MSPRILAYAYACDPDEGSEPGAGWTWTRIVAGLGETWVLTRARPPDAGTDDPYGAWSARLPERDRIHFVHVEIPWWDRFWHGRDHRPGFTRFQRLEYLAWQWLALRASRRLMAERSFDIAWHLTWANAWFGSTLASTGLPFVFGPVGGGVGTPLRLVRGMGLRMFVSEVARDTVRTVFRYLNPWCRQAMRRADLILVQNPETRDWLAGDARPRAVILPNAIVTGVERRAAPPADGPPTALFAGRLVGWKGPALAIRTMVELPDWRLAIVGDGPEHGRLRHLADQLGVADRVEFLGRLPRADVLAVMRDRAHLLLLPSLHDDSPAVVAEAIATGLPVICLDRGGPPVLGGTGVATGSMRATVRRLAEAVRAAPRDGGDAPVPTLESRRLELDALLRNAGLVELEAADARATSDDSRDAARVTSGTKHD